MKLSNKTIYQYGTALINLQINEIRFPVAIGFFLQRNIKKILALGAEIEQLRIELAQRFGHLDVASGNFNIPVNNREIAQQELNNLLNIEQDVDIHIFKLSEFENIELTYEQLDAIAFMIEE